MRSMLLIAELTFREARRRKIMWAALLLGIAFLIIYSAGLYFIYRDAMRLPPTARGYVPNMLNMLTMMALYAVNFLIIAMTILTSVDTIAGEIASGAIQAVAAKPIRRAEILLGKWLGFSGMLILYAILMVGGVVMSTRLIAGYVPPHPVEGALLMLLEGLILLNLSMLGGTFLSTLANGVFVFGLFGVAFIGGWMEQFGSLTQNEIVVNIGILSSLVLPSEAIWRRAAYLMQPAAFRSFTVSPFGSSSEPTPAMIAYTAVYLFATLALASRNFSKRDI